MAVFSQSNGCFSSLNKNQSNASIINPAFQLNINENEFSIAPFTNFNMEVYLPLTSNQLFTNKTSSGKYLVDLEDVYLSAKHKNTFFFQSDFKWFNLTGKNRKYNWNISVQERIEGGLMLNKEAINLLNLGNNAYLGENFEMNIPIHFLHFSSFNFTLAKQLNKGVGLGITMKMYLGKSLLNVNSSFDLYTEQNGEYIDIGVEGNGSVSSPMSLSNLLNGNSSNFNVFNYFAGIRNPGLGIDLGIRYQFNDDIYFNASVRDLGFIFWNKNTTKFETDGAYKWGGIDISGKLDFEELSELEQNSTIETFRDSFLNGLIVPDDRSFFTLLPSQINVGVTYKYTDRYNLAATFHTQYIQHFIRADMAFSASYLLNHNIKMFAGLSFSNFSYFNLPVGLSYKDDKFATSLSFSNIFSVFFPSRSSYFGGSINLSYRFGKFVRIKKQQIKAYPFYQRRIYK